MLGTTAPAAVRSCTNVPGARRASAPDGAGPRGVAPVAPLEPIEPIEPVAPVAPLARVAASLSAGVAVAPSGRAGRARNRGVSEKEVVSSVWSTRVNRNERSSE